MKSKILTALLSTVIAFTLWFYVVTVISPNSDRHYHNVSVTIHDDILKERGLIIVKQDVKTVSLHLEGNRTDLDKLTSDNIKLSADASRIYSPGNHSLRFAPTYPGDVKSSAISVISQDPVEVNVVVEELISKPVPVDIQYTGTLPESFMADKENRKLDYENVTVTGPKSVIDQIHMARIEVDLTDRVESVSDSYAYTLCNAAGEPVDAKMVVTDLEAVNLTLRIVRYKEVKLTVTVKDGGGATEENTEITMDSTVLQISGSDTLLEGVESIELGTINLGDITEDQTLTFPITLPEGVTNETGVSEVQVSVKLPELTVRTLTLKTIKAVQIPTGLDVQIITQALEVKVRGPKEQVEALRNTDLVANVDFSTTQVGTATVKAEIVVNADGVGAMGSYQVTATVREKQGST